MYGTDQWRGSLWRALLGIGLALATASGLEAQGPPVKVGELNSYSRMAVFSVPYRNGMQLGQDEINANGVVLGGRKLEIVFRDDGGTPVDAVRVAHVLLTRENVFFRTGAFLSNHGLAVPDLHHHRK